MKAAILAKYGAPESFELREIDRPIPKDDEVLIKTYASTVTAGDCSIRRMDFPLLFKVILRIYLGIFKPRRLILGQELSGEIVEIGKDIKRFKVGDKIFGTTGFKFGGYAQYVSLKENSSTGIIAIMPQNMTFEEAAGMPTGGLEALHFLSKGHLKKGDKLLINGAGGSIGTVAIQLGKYYGAEVTAIDSPDKIETLKLAGADYIIDYTREDFTENGQMYDAIFDVIGKSDYRRSMKSLNDKGSYLFADWKPAHKWLNRLKPKSGSKKVIFGGTEQNLKNLDFLRELIEKEKLFTVIDKIMSLDEIAEAHRYVEEGHKKGNLIIATQKHN